MKTLKGIKKGQKFRVIGNSNSHNYPEGKVLTFNKNITSDNKSFTNIAKEITGNQINILDIELVSFNIKEMKKNLSTIEKEYLLAKKDLSEKIEFCEKNCLDEYDEDTFKIMKTLYTLKENMSDIEKAKIISQLIKN